MNTQNKYSLEVWIGLIKVKSLAEENLLIEKSERAFVNVLALAKGKSDFKKKVIQKLKSMNLKHLRMENVEPLNIRIQNFKVDKIIIMKAKDLLKEGERVRFCTFHAYDI